MRFMRWSYADLMVCPTDYLEVIVQQANKEASEARNREARNNVRQPGRR